MWKHYDSLTLKVKKFAVKKLLAYWSELVIQKNPGDPTKNIRNFCPYFFLWPSYVLKFLCTSFKRESENTGSHYGKSRTILENMQDLNSCKKQKDKNRPDNHNRLTSLATLNSREQHRGKATEVRGAGNPEEPDSLTSLQKYSASCFFVKDTSANDVAVPVRSSS